MQKKSKVCESQLLQSPAVLLGTSPVMQHWALPSQAWSGRSWNPATIGMPVTANNVPAALPYDCPQRADVHPTCRINVRPAMSQILRRMPSSREVILVTSSRSSCDTTRLRILRSITACLTRISFAIRRDRCNRLILAVESVRSRVAIERNRGLAVGSRRGSAPAPRPRAQRWPGRDHPLTSSPKA